MEERFGRSSKRFDSYKQSFTFPFLLEVEVGERVIHLVWSLADYRGAIDFRFRRLIEREEDLSQKQDVIQTYTEIAEEAFEYVVGFLVRWIEGYVLSTCAYQQPAEPFYRTIPSNLTVYGYIESSFFCERYQEVDLYEAKVAEMLKRFPAKSKPSLAPEARIADTKIWIAKAKQENGDL